MRGAIPAGRLVGAAVAGLFVAAAVWYLGASPWWAAAFGAIGAAAVVVWRSVPRLEEPVWRKPEPLTAPGARDDVVLLGWALIGRHGRMQQRAVERMRAVADARLARRGLGLDAASDRERVIALIGARAYATLHSNVSNMPSRAAALSCLDALDRLASAQPGSEQAGGGRG